jgi:hypothetical protein
MTMHSVRYEYDQKVYSAEAHELLQAAKKLFKDEHKQVKLWIAQEQEGRSPEVRRDLLEACLDEIYLATNPFRVESLSKEQIQVVFDSWAGDAEAACRKLATFVNQLIESLKNGGAGATSYMLAMRIQNKVLSVREILGSQNSEEFVNALEKRAEISRAFEATITNERNMDKDDLAELTFFNAHGREIVETLIGQAYDEMLPSISRNEGRDGQWGSPIVDGLEIKAGFKNVTHKLPLIPTSKRRKRKMVALTLEYEYRQSAAGDTKVTKVNDKAAFVAFVLRAFENKLMPNGISMDTIEKVLASTGGAYSFPYLIEMLVTNDAFPTIKDRHVSVRLHLAKEDDTDTSES